jgi:hypothetical protein
MVVHPEYLQTAHDNITVLYADPGIIPDVPVSTVYVSAPRPFATKGAGDWLEFTVTRVDGDWSQPLTVHYTVGGTAQANTDFLGVSGDVTIDATRDSATFLVTPLAANRNVFRSSVVVNLQPDANGAYLLDTPRSATGWIYDDNAATPPPIAPPSGLLGWWCAEGDGADATGTHNGTIYNNVPFVHGEVGEAFGFDGGPGYVQVPNAPDLNPTSGVTIEFWVNVGFGGGLVVRKGDSGDIGYQVYFADVGCVWANDPGKHLFFTYNNYWRGGGIITDSDWHHCAIVATSGQADPVFYIDGVAQTLFCSGGDSSINLLQTSGPLQIGPSGCLVDELAIYNRALSAAEIQGIYNAGTGGKILGKLETPTFSPLGQSYATPQNVTLTSASPGTAIHYTMDGREPTVRDPAVPNGSSVYVFFSCTLKAKAFRGGWTPSDTEAESYRIEPTASDQPPTVTLSPPDGTTFLASDDIEVLAQATDPDGTVAGIQLYLGNQKVAETTDSVLRYTLSKVAAGSYTFKARAVDDVGFVAFTAPATFMVNTSGSGPVVALHGQQPYFSSSPGALLASVLGVNPGSLSSLTLSLNGGAPSSLTPNTGAFTLTPALVNGVNNFTLTATDNQGHTGQANTTVYLVSAAPTISITSPQDNSSVAVSRINVSGTFTSAAIKGIDVNGVPAFITGSTWQALNVLLAPGLNTIIATATDLAGGTGTMTIHVNAGSGPLPDPVQLQATPIAGFAALTVTFTVTASVPVTLADVLYDFTGDNTSFEHHSDLNPVTHTYQSAGQFFPTVTLVTSSGTFSSAGGWNGDPSRLRINVQAQPVVDPNATITVADPVDLKWMPGNVLYVLSRSSATVTEYNVAVTPPTVIATITGIGTSPNGLDVDSDGNVYVAVTGDNQVKKYKPVTGGFQLDTSFNGTGIVGGAGSGDGQFNAPFDVAVTPDGTEIAVSDSGNDRVQSFTSAGGFISSLGQYGTDAGQFNNPVGIFYDDVGTLYAVDSGNARITIGNSWCVTGTSGAPGSDVGLFRAPINLSVGDRGIYAADTGNGRIQAFEPTTDGHHGAAPFVPRWATTGALGLAQPRGVAAVNDLLEERVYVADTGNGRVLLVSFPSDNPEGTWTAMTQRLLAGDIAGAIPYFSYITAENYRAAYLSIGPTELASIIAQIPAITPIFIAGDEAQYTFDQVIDGFTITFPIRFVRENGLWKIMDY